MLKQYEESVDWFDSQVETALQKIYEQSEWWKGESVLRSTAETVAQEPTGGSASGVNCQNEETVFLYSDQTLFVLSDL